MKSEILKLGVLVSLSIFCEQIYAARLDYENLMEYQDLKLEAKVYESEESRREFDEEFKMHELIKAAEDILLADGQN